MKHMPLIFMLALFSFTLMGCQKKSSSSSSSSNALCAGTGYYTVPGCPGYYGTTTTGGTTGGTSNCYIGTNYYNYPGCPGFCQYQPTHSSCAGTTTGGTTGGTVNPYPNYPSTILSQSWGVKYPPSNVPPSGSCSSTYTPSGISFTPYETRKATMTLVGHTGYYADSPDAPNYMNTSSLLTTVNGAKTLYTTDSFLKVRFRAKPQPESSSSSPYCYGRAAGVSIAGYTKLQFSLSLRGQRADNSWATEPLGSFTVGVNNCTPGIDLSSYASQYPNGVYVIVEAVKGNQSSFPPDYNTNGFTNWNGFSDIRSSDCWVLDVEVAADGTKTFD